MPEAPTPASEVGNRLLLFCDLREHDGSDVVRRWLPELREAAALLRQQQAENVALRAYRDAREAGKKSPLLSGRDTASPTSTSFVHEFANPEVVALRARLKAAEYSARTWEQYGQQADARCDAAEAALAKAREGIMEIQRRTGLLINQNTGRWDMRVEHDRRIVDVLNANQEIARAALDVTAKVDQDRG